MKRKLVSIFLLLSMALNLILPFSGCGSEEGGSVTRGEWIEMLAAAFGMDSYASEEPYYRDITAEQELFPYVQSSAEWDVLSIFGDEELGADKQVTAEEVASTAAIAVGFDVAEEMFDEEGGFNAEPSVTFALQQNILPADKKLSENMTLEECESALEAAKSAYLTPPTEEKAVAVLSEDITDMTGLTPDEYEIDGSQLLIPTAESGSVLQDASGNTVAEIDTGDGVVEVTIGDVLLLPPTPENPAGVAYKISAIEEINRAIVITTEAPTLADLYEELDVQMTVEADPDSIIWADGVVAAVETNPAEGVASPGGDTYQISFLGAGPNQAEITPLADYSTSFSHSFEWSQGDFEKNWSNQNSSVIGSEKGAQELEKSNFVYDKTPSIEDFGGSTDSWTENLRVENKFSGGYRISGEISINALTVSTDVEYKRSWLLNIPYGVKQASVQVDSDISTYLKLEGNLSEELKIATIPIPIGPTGLSVTVDLYLYANASGSLEVRAELSSIAKVEFSDEKLKHMAEAQADTNVDAAIEIDFGADLSATLNALGIVKIVDAGARAGGTLTANASVSGMCRVSEENGIAKTTYQESLTLKADLYVPTVTIYAGGSDTLIGSLGLTGTWDILTKDNGAHHIELMNYEWVFWEETVITDEEGNVAESESITAGEIDGIGAADGDRLDLDVYVLTLSGESRQLVLSQADEGAAVVWTSDDTDVAVVDENGLVTPVGTGYTIITAALQENPSVYVKCAVYVEQLGENNWQFIPASVSVRI